MAPKDPNDPNAVHDDDEDAKAIRARRNRFIASALAGLSAAATVVACSSTEADTDAGTKSDASVTTPEKDTGAGVDATPQPCLSPVPPDGGDEDAATADANADAEPQPCLKMAPPDAGGD